MNTTFSQIKAFSPQWFDYAFNCQIGHMPHLQLRYLSENIVRHFKIGDAIDPLHIAIIIKDELIIENGQSSFNGTSFATDASTINALVKRLLFYYSSYIPANSALLRSLLTLTLGQTAQTKRPQQHEIDAEIQKALETKMRHNYTTTAVVGISTTPSGNTSLGFHFDNQRVIGEMFNFEDGTMFEVLALV